MSSLEKPLVLHKGIYKRSINSLQAVFMITGMTIGAGVLGLPYAISKVGVTFGILSLCIVGLAIFFVNFLIGELVSHTKESLQLPGLVGKYINKKAQHFVSFLTVITSYGALLAYIIGEGEVLQSLFGGSRLVWSILFWAVASEIVIIGVDIAKKFQMIVSSLVIVLIAGVSFALIPSLSSLNLFYINTTNLFFPFGVILFALHAASSIAEAHVLLPKAHNKFRFSLILGSFIPLILYILFSTMVVGVLGVHTSEVATLALGERFGKPLLILGNIIAFAAMFTGFVGLGIALKQTFIWDNKLSTHKASLLVISMPLVLFLLGIRSFIFILNLIGGVFISIESLIMIWVFIRARKLGVISHFKLASFLSIGSIITALFFLVLLCISCVQLFV